MPLQTNADISINRVDPRVDHRDDPNPQPFVQPTPPLESPDWPTGPAEYLARAINASVKPWAQLKINFLTRIYESAAHGHYPVTPTVEDIAKVFERELTTPDEATKAALGMWIATIAGEAIAQIDEAKARIRERAESRAEWARQQAEKERVESERQALMERSEFDRQAVLAQEAEARKWAAFESQKAEFEAYKARTSAPAEVA